MARRKPRKHDEIKPSEDTRRCIECGLVKTLDEYKYSKHTVDNRDPTCRGCLTEIARVRRAKEPEKYKEYRRWYNKENKERISEYHRNNKEKAKQYREKSKLRQTEESKQARREYLREYRKQPRARAYHRISTAVAASLRQKRGTAWTEIFGYSIDMLMYHIEALFQPGMSWDNIGEWHIDHVIPKSWFGAHEEYDDSVIAAWNIFNLQPLWAEDNLKKNNKHK